MKKMQQKRHDLLRRLGVAALLAGLLAIFGAAYAQQGNSPDARIIALAFDSSTGTILKAEGNALYRSSDGRDWVQTPLPLSAKGHVGSMAIASKGNGAVYLSGPGIGVLRSEDGGRTWNSRGDGLPEGKLIALATHADQPDTVYAYVTDQGFFRSEDAGASWRLMDKGPREKIVQLVHSNMPGSMQTGWFFAATAKGVKRSMDCFCGWRDAGGLSGKVSAVSYDPSEPRRVYAATSDGLLFSASGGEQWTKLASPAAGITTLVATPSGALYAAAGDGVLYRTPDQGKTWERING